MDCFNIVGVVYFAKYPDKLLVPSLINSDSIPYRTILTPRGPFDSKNCLFVSSEYVSLTFLSLDFVVSAGAMSTANEYDSLT